MAITGTSTLVTAESRRTPPKITRPVRAARPRPTIHAVVEDAPQLACTDSEIELDCTALNTKP